MTQETHDFQAEVSRLLDIVAHALYSNRDIFLRELISNASDACDRLRYLALTEPGLMEGGDSPRITLKADQEARTLTVSDSGIGMDRQELVENLGTIARSGTRAFVSALEAAKGAGQEQGGALNQIGQFGVGFYAAFMVADRVEVLSRKAGTSQGHRWVSDGKGGFTVEEAAEIPRGTSIVLSLKEDAADYLTAYRLRSIVRAYSDHIDWPVVLLEGDKEDQVNSGLALWTRPKAEITAEQYNEFYRHIAHFGGGDPWATIHFRAEGAIEYTGLLFIPSEAPLDLFEPERRQRVKLYVRRVFITDDAKGLLPPWLRFLRGVVDTPDLPLNISREMLQDNPLLTKIQAGLTRRVLSELKTRAADAESYAAFWSAFGAVLKEGLYEDFERRDELLALCRFASTKVEGLTSLADYVARMKPGQEAIHILSGDDAAALRRSPHLEGFLAKDVEVLLLTDPIDEFWVPAVREFEGKPLRSIAEAGADLEAIEGDPAEPRPETPPEADLTALVAALKANLADSVKDVRVSSRLTESPVCLAADAGDMSIHLERLMRQHNRPVQDTKRVLEINPSHALVRGLAEAVKGGRDIADAARLLLDQARLVEGLALPDPVAFSRRLAAVLTRALV